MRTKEDSELEVVITRTIEDSFGKGNKFWLCYACCIYALFLNFEGRTLGDNVLSNEINVAGGIRNQASDWRPSENPQSFFINRYYRYSGCSRSSNIDNIYFFIPTHSNLAWNSKVIDIRRDGTSCCVCAELFFLIYSFAISFDIWI